MVTYLLTCFKGKYLYVIVITPLNCDIFVDKILRDRYMYFTYGFKATG